MNEPILIVEDEEPIAKVIAKNLESAGYACETVHDGRQALKRFDEVNPQLLVLDVMLPGIDGLEVLRRVREVSRVPILLLTARSMESDKVLGLELGADDYVTKPFGTQELVARVRALLRRTSADAPSETLVRGALRVDPERREVSLNGQLIETTSLEFELLHTVALKPGRVFTRESLMNRVWGDDRVVDTRSIDSLVSRLRKKLEAASDEPIIETVWGAGYRFREPGG